MVVHTSPQKRLICHHCNAVQAFPLICDKCGGTNLLAINAGTQNIETSLKKHFPPANIFRLDSDKEKETGIYKQELEDANIIVGTSLSNNIPLQNIAVTAFLCIETEFSNSEYDTEERIYNTVLLHQNKGEDVVLQTYLPNLPIVRHLSEGNFKSFLQHTLAERKQFGYPPYGELVYVWVENERLENVKDTIFKLVNKLQIANEA